MTEDSSQPLTEVDIRLHAINLAAGLHRDTFRFTRELTVVTDVAQLVLADARVFADWIANGGEPGVAEVVPC